MATTYQIFVAICKTLRRSIISKIAWRVRHAVWRDIFEKKNNAVICVNTVFKIHCITVYYESYSAWECTNRQTGRLSIVRYWKKSVQGHRDNEFYQRKNVIKIGLSDKMCKEGIIELRFPF